MRDSSFVNIQYWMVSGLGLKDKELIVYAIIHGFSHDGEGEYRSGYSYVMEFFGWSRPTATKAFESLIEKGLINKRIEDVNGVKFNRYSVSLQVVKNLYMGSKESLHGGSKESLHMNKVLNKGEVKGEADRFLPNFNHMDEIVSNKANHQMWIEQTYMKFRFRPKRLGAVLQQFTDELVLKNKVHSNMTDFKNHFLNWALTLERNGELQRHQK